LIFELQDRYQLVISLPIRDEIQDVLTRPALRAKFPHLDDAITDTIMTLLDDADWIVLPEVPAVSRDPKDDIFLATAKVGAADYLVSEDNDLLELNPYGKIQVINGLAFLKVVRPAETSPDADGAVIVRSPHLC
jgi:hypothetical protein